MYLVDTWNHISRNFISSGNKREEQRQKKHLHRPVSVGLSDAQVDEAGHRQTHVEPITEAEIVDELEDVLHTQEDQTHQPLKAPTQSTVNVLCQEEKKSRVFVHNVPP